MKSKGFKFKVKLTGDFFDSNGNTMYEDMGLHLLANESNLEFKAFDEHRSEIGVDQVSDAQGVVVLTPKVTADTVAHADDLIAIGRFGVGYDSVDVDACTKAKVLAYITVGAVDRSVAEATVGWILALSHNVLVKDELVRKGSWADRSNHMGRELRERTLGVIGLGGIARETIRLLGTFNMNPPLAFDPYVDEETARALNVNLVSLDTLLAQADFVSIHCPLCKETRGLIGEKELARMKPSAYLLNTARGGIVDEDALFSALKNKSIAGAAIDCFENEPITSPHRFSELPNVILAPHSIAWTKELFRDIGCAVFQGMIDLSHGRKPKGVLNPELFEDSEFIEKWKRFQA